MPKFSPSAGCGCCITVENPAWLIYHKNVSIEQHVLCCYSSGLGGDVNNNYSRWPLFYERGTYSGGRARFKTCGQQQVIFAYAPYFRDLRISGYADVTLHDNNLTGIYSGCDWVGALRIDEIKLNFEYRSIPDIGASSISQWTSHHVYDESRTAYTNSLHYCGHHDISGALVLGEYDTDSGIIHFGNGTVGLFRDMYISPYIGYKWFNTAFYIKMNELDGLTPDFYGYAQGNGITYGYAGYDSTWIRDSYTSGIGNTIITIGTDASYYECRRIPIDYYMANNNMLNYSACDYPWCDSGVFRFKNNFSYEVIRYTPSYVGPHALPYPENITCPFFPSPPPETPYCTRLKWDGGYLYPISGSGLYYRDCLGNATGAYPVSSYPFQNLDYGLNPYYYPGYDDTLAPVEWYFVASCPSGGISGYNAPIICRNPLLNWGIFWYYSSSYTTSNYISICGVGSTPIDFTYENDSYVVLGINNNYLNRHILDDWSLSDLTAIDVSNPTGIYTNCSYPQSFNCPPLQTWTQNTYRYYNNSGGSINQFYLSGVTNIYSGLC